MEYQAHLEPDSDTTRTTTTPKRNAMKKVISVRFKDNGKSYYFDPADADIKAGDYVIVETARGM